LNFAGKSGSHVDFGAGAHGHTDSVSKGADSFTVPDAHLLFSGDYARSGADLIISDHLHRVVVSNYFHGDKRPALVSPDGAPLDPKVIDALTGHVQYAQAGTAVAAKVVGHVVKMTGSASIVRNGVTIDVNNGDNVYQNDVVQTGSGSTLGLVMIDGTTFNLTANARLMMNDLTYDATSTSNTSLFTLVQGAATFVAGQVAKTGDMKVSTPVATMGIRGTAVILDFSAIDGTVSVSVVDQRDGQIHALQVYNPRGDLIATVVSNGSVLTLRPTATFEVIAQESNKTVAQVLTEFNAFQQLLSTYEIAKQLFPNTPFPTDGRRGDNTQQPLTKFAGSSSSPSDTSPGKNNGDSGGPRDAKGGGAVDPITFKPTGEITDPKIKTVFNPGDDAPKQFLEVSATSIPFVVTPSPVSRISSGPGDHFGPVMSADGQFVTYDPDGAIYLFDRKTGATKTIASPGEGLTFGSPTISSDGHFVVYQGSDGTRSWIFIYNNDASDTAHYGQSIRLMSGGQAAISGDGSKLVIEQGGSIGLYDQQGHELASITGAAVGITGTLWKPAISADGHVIAFWSSDLSSPGGAGQLFTYDLSTATVRPIASTATGAGTSAASFSADGHYVVYQSDAAGGHSEIYLYDLHTGQVVFHTANPQASYNPVLSPDGHFIILASDARLTDDDKNAVTDIYVIDVTDPSHPAYKLVSVLDDGTQGDDASNLGAAISAGGQFIAFGSRASNFSSGDTRGTGDIFVVDPTSGHSAIILESRNSPAVLGTSGVIKLTGDHSGITLGSSDSRLTASFDSHGDIQWSFSEPRSDFASLQPGQISVLDFVITLRTDRSTTEIPVKVSIYDVDQPVVSVADAAPVASPVTLAAGTEDTGYTIASAALLAGVVDIDGPSLSISAVGILSGGGGIVDNHDGTFSYTPAPNYNGPVVFNYTASDGTLSASSTATLDIAAVNDAPTVIKARFAVSEGGTVVLGAANIGVADPDSTSFTFTVSNVSHGKFQTTTDGTTWVDASAFTTADLNAGHVRFVHDGGEAAPTFAIQADDGEASNHLSATAAGTVDFTNVNDAPTVSSAVTGGGAEGSGPAAVNLLNFASDADPGAVLHVANLVWTDTGSGLPAGFALSPDGNSISVDTNSLAYNSLAEGETFTAHFGYDVVDEHGASVHQTAAVRIAGTNDAPVFTTGPAITQLSVPAGGVPFSRGETFAFGPDMSSDGRFVVFSANNEVVGQDDSSRLGDIYLYDRLTGTYNWISDPAKFANSHITLHSGETYHGLATISLDGQFVAFRGQFELTQIISGQPVTFTQSEMFLYNTGTGVTTLVPGLNGDEPSINANGSLIAATGQSLTAPSNTFTYNDVLVTDRLGNVVTRISGDANASPVNTADISADGRYVTFWSTASQIEVKNVKPGGGLLDNLTFNVGASWPAGPSTPAGPVAQVYVFDRQTETINLVSVSPTGEMGNGNSSVRTLLTGAGFIDIGDDWKSAFSADGRFVIFQSNASNLVAGDNNGATDVFLYDLQTHQVQLVSAAVDGSSANGSSYRPAISSDGHHIVFASEATNLLGASNTPAGASGFQTYIRDFDPATGLLSTGFTGFHNGDNQYGDSISRDGGIVAFGGAALAFNVNQGQAEFISAAAGTVKFSGGSISDYNPAVDTLTVTMSVAHGTLSPVAAIVPGSGLTIVGGFDGSQGTLKFTGSIDAINHALDSGVTYTPTAGGPDAIAMTVTDGHGGIATHTVQFDPRAPQITGVSTIGNTIAFDHDQPQALLLAQGQVKFFNDSISDSSPGFNQNTDAVTVTVSVGHGTLTPVALVSGVTILGGFDGHAGTLKFTGAFAAVRQAMQSGAIYAATSGGPDTITVTVTDGHGGTATQSTQFNPLAPAIDGELTDGQYEIFVVDRSGGTAGLLVEDTSLTGPRSDTLFTKGAFGFTDADLTDTHTATVIGSPVIDTSHAPGFVVPNFVAPDGGLGVFTLAVTESSGSGQVSWTFTAGNGLVQSLGRGQYVTETVAVQLDDHHGGYATQNVTITIGGVNDAPEIVIATFAVAEGGTAVLGAGDIALIDPDATSFAFTVSGVTHGSFQTTTNGATWAAATTFTGDDVAAGHVRFVHDGGEDAPTFSIQADDGINSGSPFAGTVNFTHVNDAPVVEAPAAHYTVTGRTPLLISGTGLDVHDVDGNGGLETATLHVGEGALTVALGANALSVSGNGTSTIMLNGSAGLIAALLAGDNNGSITYSNSSAHLSASTSLTLTVNDNGNSGSGGPQTSTATATIDIASLANTLTFTLDTTPSGSAEQRVDLAPDGDLQTSFQGSQSVAALSDGGWVVTWVDYRNNANGADIYQRHYDADGNPAGETIVNTAGPSHDYPAVAALPDGGWVVVFQDSRAGDSWDLYARRYDSAGIPVGSDFAVTSAPISSQQLVPTITILNDGRWLVSWLDNRGGTNAVWQQLFTASGDQEGSATQVSSAPAGSTASVQTVAPLPDGGWLVVWADDRNGHGNFIDGGNYDIYERRFDSNGHATTANDVRVDAATSGNQLVPKIAVLADGGWVIAWHDQRSGNGTSDIYQARFDADGNRMSASDVYVDQNPFGNDGQAIATALPDGGWLVTWDEYRNGSDEVFQRRYNADGTSGDVTRINLNAQHDQSIPAVALTTGGQAVVTWSQQAYPADYSDVYQRVLNLPGIGEEDHTIILPKISASVTNTDGSETLVLKLSGFPAGATFSVGAPGAGDDAGKWIISKPSDIASLATTPLTMTAPANYNGNFTLHVDAVVTDPQFPIGTETFTHDIAVSIAPVNDAPVITHAALTISQGHTVTVTTADINFVDPDSPAVTYTVSNLSHGHFETGLGNDAVETTTFTSADVAAGFVSFVDDGSSTAPAFSLTPNDGSIDGVEVQGAVTFSASNYTLTSSEGVTINVTPEGATSGFVFPGAGNVTTPGTPEDRIAIGYDVGASHVVRDNAPLLGTSQMAPITSETHTSGGTTFVSATLDAGHDVTLKQTIALGNDANYFTTTIEITNNGPDDISNVRFLRNFDPDQDVQAHHDYNTLNEVVQNPDGAETFAILSATGVESHTKVAMIGLGAEWRASVFGFTNTDPYATHAFDMPSIPDKTIPQDLSLSLTSSLGTLTANGGHAEVTYITTNNVATAGSNALYGTAGADTINGLGGDDLLIGLKGADTFVFNAASSGSGHDTVADFTPGQDQISLDYHAFDAAGPNDFSSWLRTHATTSGSDVLIDLNVDGQHPGVDTILC
jgi:VCBS repeat-containing protein